MKKLLFGILLLVFIVPINSLSKIEKEVLLQLDGYHHSVKNLARYLELYKTGKKPIRKDGDQMLYIGKGKIAYWTHYVERVENMYKKKISDEVNGSITKVKVVNPKRVKIYFKVSGRLKIANFLVVKNSIRFRGYQYVKEKGPIFFQFSKKLPKGQKYLVNVRKIIVRFKERKFKTLFRNKIIVVTKKTKKTKKTINFRTDRLVKGFIWHVVTLDGWKGTIVYDPKQKSLIPYVPKKRKHRK